MKRHLGTFFMAMVVCFIWYGVVLYLHRVTPRTMDDGTTWFFLIAATLAFFLFLFISLHVRE